MCDFVPGELIACYRRDDTIAQMMIEQLRGQAIPHISVRETLSDKLAPLKLAARPQLGFDFVRLEVPPHEEAFKVNILHFFYKELLVQALLHHHITPATAPQLFTGWSQDHFQVGVNSYLTVCAKKAAVGKLAFTPTHGDYKKMIGWVNPARKVTTKVLILDTGVFSEKHFHVVDRKNFLDAAKPNDVTDDHHHGTAIASVLEDLCAGIPLVIYKVADEDGKASEWDVVAALAAATDAHVVNVSLAFGLKDRECTKCGRASHSSRSAIFDTLIRELEKDDDAIVVAAAGNKADPALAFPARFGNVVGIESINKAGNLSDFSNYSDKDSEGNPHDNVFVLPGGQEKPAEYFATASDGTELWGTSFATAYGAAIAAALWDQNPRWSAQDLLRHLRNNADKKAVVKHDPAKHGKGLMMYK